MTTQDYKKRLLIGAVGAIGVAVGLTGCFSSHGQPTDAAPTTTKAVTTTTTTTVVTAPAVAKECKYYLLVPGDVDRSSGRPEARIDTKEIPSKCGPGQKPGDISWDTSK